MRKNACKAFLGASGKENRHLQAERFVRLRFLKHMHASNSSLKSFGSFSFESYAGFMRRNSFFCRKEKSGADFTAKKLRQPPDLLNLHFDSRKTERPPWLSF